MSKKSLKLRNLLIIDLIKQIYLNKSVVIITVIISVAVGMLLNFSFINKERYRGIAHIPMNPMLQTYEDKAKYILKRILYSGNFSFVEKLEPNNDALKTYFSTYKSEINIIENFIIEKKGFRFIEIKFETYDKKNAIDTMKKLTSDVNFHLVESFNNKINTNLYVITDIYKMRNDFNYKMLKAYYFRIYGSPFNYQELALGKKDSNIIPFEDVDDDYIPLLEPDFYMAQLEIFYKFSQEEHAVYLELLEKTTDKNVIKQNLEKQLLISNLEPEYKDTRTLYYTILSKPNIYKIILSYIIAGAFVGVILALIKGKRKIF